MVILFVVYLIMPQLMKLYGIDRMISERVYSDAVVAQLNVIAWRFSDRGQKTMQILSQDSYSPGYPDT
jgi:hypothetical protein